ncbi:MAG: cysteine hydrolase [Proteobacteria bacterium]|nr:MAG: cysteine hydrolase [Pseudomonadota bacterium]
MTKPAPITNAMHLCIDMQNIFAKGGVWETPWMERVLPIITNVASAYAGRTVFTRFIPPAAPAERPGRWALYYEKWIEATLAQLPSDQIELVPSLARLVPPAIVFDKLFYSAFNGSGLHDWLQKEGVTTLVITGAETDICVLSTTLSAVDLGYRTILIEDAMCSSSDEGHDALMSMYRARLTLQIKVISSQQLGALWAHGSL